MEVQMCVYTVLMCFDLSLRFFLLSVSVSRFSWVPLAVDAWSEWLPRGFIHDIFFLCTFSSGCSFLWQHMPWLDVMKRLLLLFTSLSLPLPLRSVLRVFTSLSLSLYHYFSHFFHFSDGVKSCWQTRLHPLSSVRCKEWMRVGWTVFVRFLISLDSHKCTTLLSTVHLACLKGSETILLAFEAYKGHPLPPLELHTSSDGRGTLHWFFLCWRKEEELEGKHDICLRGRDELV